MAGTDALETVQTRNSFYRDGYRTLLRIALIEAAVIVVLTLGIVAALISARPQIRYFASDNAGRIIPLVPLDQPYQSDDYVNSWVSEAIRGTMTLGFHDYRERLQKANSAYFTLSGWNSFFEVFRKSDYLKLLQDNYVITAEPGPPTITEQRQVGGVYRWRVSVNVVYKFQKPGSTQTFNPQTVATDLLIVRVSTLDNLDGLGIAQWIGRATTSTPDQ